MVPWSIYAVVFSSTTDGSFPVNSHVVVECVLCVSLLLFKRVKRDEYISNEER